MNSMPPLNRASVNDSRCIDVLGSTLRSYDGIQRADFDASTGRLHVDYDPLVLNDDRAVTLVRRAGQTAAQQMAECDRKEGAGCTACANTTSDQLAHYYQRLAQMQPTSQGGGLLTLSPAGGLLTDGGATASPSAPTGGAIPKRPGRGQLEIIFTVVTLLASVAAFLGQTFALVPAPVIMALYVVAFVTGGYYGTLDSLTLAKKL